MALNRAIYESSVYQVVILRNAPCWYFQVFKGPHRIHVETMEFNTFREAVDYAFETYDLMAE